MYGVSFGLTHPHIEAHRAQGVEGKVDDLVDQAALLVQQHRGNVSAIVRSLFLCGQQMALLVDERAVTVLDDHGVLLKCITVTASVSDVPRLFLKACKRPRVKCLNLPWPLQKQKGRERFHLSPTAR